MIKIIMVFTFFTVLFFFCKEIYNIWKKGRATNELEDVRTQEDLMDIEEEVTEREQNIQRRKEALYSKEETETEA